MTTEPFSAPAAPVLADESLPAELPKERHYRPITRRMHLFTRIGGFGLMVLVFVAATFRGMSSLWMMVFFWVALVYWLLRHRTKVPGWIKRNEDAAAQISSGELEAATQTFEALCREARPMPLLHNLFVFNRGVAFLHVGELERALSLFSAALASGWTRSAQIPNLHALVLSESALALALGGEVIAAERILRRAHEHVSDPARGKLAVADAVIALRGGSWRAAAQQIRERWRQAEGSLGAPGVRALRVLWAFALEQLPPEERGDQRRLIDGVFPFRAGEFDYLTLRWPELRVFLLAQGLTTAA